MPRSTMKPALGAAVLVPCLLFTACGRDAGLEDSHPPRSPETAVTDSRAPIHKGYAWNAASRKWEAVHYAEVDGLAVIEGDIVIGSVEEVEARTRAVEARGGPETGDVQAQGVVITTPTFPVRWPNAVVPYTISDELFWPTRVQAAIGAWQSSTRVRFVPRTASNAHLYPDYVTFQPAAADVCSSKLGKEGGQQFVNLGSLCATDTMIHEMGHVLGMYHEQSRGDRDSHVSIRWENIREGYSGNFLKAPLGHGRDVSTYDYTSIMHYPASAFPREPGLVTIEALGGHTIAPGTTPSAGDVATIQRIYSADDADFFMQQLFVDVLNRPADPSGFTYYMNSLANCFGEPTCLDAARVSAARSIFESAEHRQQHPELDPNASNYKAAYISNCYTSFMRRPQSPADGTYWLDFLNSTGDYTAVIRGFVTSAEYRSRFM